MFMSMTAYIRSSPLKGKMYLLFQILLSQVLGPTGISPKNGICLKIDRLQQWLAFSEITVQLHRTAKQLAFNLCDRSIVYGYTRYTSLTVGVYMQPHGYVWLLFWDSIPSCFQNVVPIVYTILYIKVQLEHSYPCSEPFCIRTSSASSYKFTTHLEKTVPLLSQMQIFFYGEGVTHRKVMVKFYLL